MKEELKIIIKQNKIKLIIEFFGLVFFVYFMTCPAKYLGKIIDLLYDIETNKNIIIYNVMLMILSAIGMVVSRMVYKYIEFTVHINTRKELQDNLFKKIMKMKLEDINLIKNGEIMSYFVRDTKKVTKFILKFYSSSVRVLSNIIIVTILMTHNSNIKLAICAIIPIVLTSIVMVFIRKRIKNSFKKSQKAFTNFSEFVQENTDSIRTVKAFAGEKIEKENFEEKNKKLRDTNLIVSYYEGLLDVAINIGIGISYTIAILWGSRLVISGGMTVGDIVAFLGYLSLLNIPIKFVPWVVSRYDELKISIERLNKIFNMKEEKIKIMRKKAKDICGNIEIKGLTFHYPNSLDEVLSNINIDVKKGETLGIIGVIGSGKTTLMNLLLKLYYVERGKITIDGKDINDIPTEVLRNSICYITQDNFLFSSSIKENINLFKDNYTDEEIEESTKNAMIYSDIKEMEEGINTIIGEKGVDMSGGQKQRVVISRAFLRNSNIIIFDDTFSALDNRTEQHVLNNIKKLVEEKTCIIVSNRISDIKDCDKIIVMDKGKIVEEGNHKTLLEKKGDYFKFYEGQANNVIEELA